MRRESWCRKGENCESEKAKGKNERQLFPTPLEHEVFECDEEKKNSLSSLSLQPTNCHPLTDCRQEPEIGHHERRHLEGKSLSAAFKGKEEALGRAETRFFAKEESRLSTNFVR